MTQEIKVEALNELLEEVERMESASNSKYTHAVGNAHAKGAQGGVGMRKEKGTT